MSVTNEQVIADQARTILQLRDERRTLLRAVDEVIRQLVCIPGPLNGNRLNYTHEQQEELKDLLNILSDAHDDVAGPNRD